ncbi:MAG: MotA/TolQ/ExbB proton channel family protein [Planctomycetota bacterium]|jgi:biopolymer transport protein ExbB|nr:MotA/TolQ/ExbB proton channel family protein [Planctomycetota bacterium]
MNWGLTWLTTWLAQGGPVMYVLLGVSLTGVAFFFYTWLVLRKRALFPAALVKTTEAVTDDAGCAAVENLCRAVGGPLAEILVTVIASRHLSKDEADTLVEGAGRRTAHYLSRGVLALEVVATISPLLGLLGTVTGMYAVFAEIANNPSGEIGRLSGGIAEAILTTIAGLVIAVPAYVTHSFFARRVEELVLEMERLAVGLMLRLRN